MKNFLVAILGIVIITGLTFACNSEENSNESVVTSKKDVLSLIKKDISAHKYYPNVENKYDYSAKNFHAFLNKNQDLMNANQTNVMSRDSLSKELYVDAVVDFYKNTDHSEQEIREKFEFTDQLLTKYGSDYLAMLNGLVVDGIIPAEEKDIIIAYIDFYYETESFTELVNITSIFTQYVNESDFSEFEKRGMLTIFDTFKENEKLFDTTTPFDFMQFINAAKVPVNGKPSKGTSCGGTMIIGMVGGGLTGNGIGFVVGSVGAAFSCWQQGCFD